MTGSPEPGGTGRPARKRTGSAKAKRAPRQRRRTDAPAGKAAASTNSTASRASTPRRVPGTVAAAYPGQCPLCRERWKAGALITAWGEQWVHADCGDAERNRHRILDGDTFRSQKASTWRRGQSPGSAPNPR